MIFIAFFLTLSSFHATYFSEGGWNIKKPGASFSFLTCEWILVWKTAIHLRVWRRLYVCLPTFVSFLRSFTAVVLIFVSLRFLSIRYKTHQNKAYSDVQVLDLKKKKISNGIGLLIKFSISYVGSPPNWCPNIAVVQWQNKIYIRFKHGRRISWDLVHFYDKYVFKIDMRFWDSWCFNLAVSHHPDDEQ